jgi:hypothetical protein
MERGDPEAQARELAYAEFEVKEQDRWLPIANGRCFLYLPCPVELQVSPDLAHATQSSSPPRTGCCRLSL